MPRDREYDDRHSEYLAILLARGDRPYLDTNEAEELIDYLLSNERKEEALAASNYAISLHKNDTALLIQRAIILVEFRRLEEARKILMYVTPFEQQNPDFHIAWGDLHVQDGDVLKGIESYDQAIACEPEGDDSYFETILMIASRLNRDEHCAYVFKYADLFLSKKPHDPDILFERAYAEDKCGEDEKSIETYMELLQYNPFSDMAWYNYALICTRCGLFENAGIAFDRALALSPDFVDAYCNYGNFLASSEQYSLAINQYAKYVSLAKDTDSFDESAYELMGDCYFNWAVSERSKLEKDYKNEISRYYNVALTDEVRDLFLKAIDFYNLCIDCNCNPSKSWMQIADITSLMGDNKSALKIIDKAIKIDPSAPGIYFMKSALYDREGDLEKTLQTLLEGISYDSEAPRPWLECAKLVFRMTGNSINTSSRQYFNRIKSRFPNGPATSLAEGFLLYLCDYPNDKVFSIMKKIKNEAPEVFMDACEDFDFAYMLTKKPYDSLTKD